MGARFRKKGFHFLANFPSHPAEELDHAYMQVPGPYHLYWPKQAVMLRQHSKLFFKNGNTHRFLDFLERLDGV